MKDYSRFVKYPKGFIISYEVKDGIIYINTPETLKTGVPQEVPATKVNVKYYEARMEKQYRLLIENQDAIIDSLTNKISLASLITPIALVILACISLGISQLAGIVLFAISLLTLGGGMILNHQIVKKMKSEIKTYERFLNSRQALEAASQIDKNITKNLSEEAQKNIRRNTDLQTAKMIDNVFNIDFMDKTSLKDLREMLLRYSISRSLQSEIEFRSPNQDETQENAKKSSPKKKSLNPKPKKKK